MYKKRAEMREEMKNLKQKKTYVIGVMVFVLGMIIGLGIGYSKVDTNNSIPEKESEEQEQREEWQKETLETNLSLSSAGEETTSSEAQTTEISKEIEWNKEQIYTGGQEVVYKNRKYRAKWWTQGEEPGKEEWGAWEYVAEMTPMILPDNKETETTIQKEVAAKEDFKVVVYYPSWKPDELSKIQYDTVTHIIYAFAIPTSEGTLLPLDNPETAKKIIETAHKNNTKVMLAIGGWSYHDTPLEGTFKEATNTEEKRKKLADSIMAFCEEYQFDGIDMDWEHPRIDDASGKQYEELMLLLEKQLHEKGKLLTAAVLSGATPDGTVYYDAAAHSDIVLNAVDWIHVMAYDGGDGERHSSYEFAENCGTYWKEVRNLPSYKVVLGVPFYGRPSWASYEDILAVNPEADKTDMTSIYGMEAWYNGKSTIQKKTRYAMEHLGGIMVWEVTQDTTEKEKSLLTAIGEEIKR